MVEKNNHLGDDPLAWLSGGETMTDSAITEAANSPVEQKTDTELVEDSFAAIAKKGNEIVNDFYQHLFDNYPELQPLFEGVSIDGQQKKLQAALVMLVENLRQPDLLEEYLKELGERHQSYGVQEADYDKVSVSLLTALQTHAGHIWTAEVEKAWVKTLTAVKDIMLSAYESVNKDVVTSNASVEPLNQAHSFALLDHMATSVMISDREFNIIYANKSAIALLGEYEDVLGTIYPGFSAQKIVGSNMDIYHKHPVQQRELLSDLNNLPYTADIEFGSLYVRLTVNAWFDHANNHVGFMLEWKNTTADRVAHAESDAQNTALNNVMGVISFDMDGIIIDVNDNFLEVVGYSRDEVIGQHHRLFVEADYAESEAYTEFWAKLKRGEYDEGQYKRIGKQGKEVWLQASYNPILDSKGKAYKVTKFATDITQEKLRQADVDGQLQAIDKAMGIISFDMDGTIADINDNFLDVVGYRREEVIGQHHRLFAGEEVATTQEYTDFWAKLNRGEYDEGQYRRLGKDGKEIWLQASYNPIFDLNGKPYKVVKYAADITEQKLLQITVEKALAETSQVMNAMAQGDLTKVMSGDFEGEFAQLQTAVNETVTRIGDIVKEITESAISVSMSASEISQGNVDLSQRTEEQASSLEETAASMEELTSTVKQNSENAIQANELAASAREKAERGGTVILEAINAMSAINEASKKVADIIGVIDDIAFQTNLLALNAAVEAARAGQQGRGFAVVASEVRNLAQRSASAAKEIKALISDSGEKVREGSDLVDESGRTLEEIVIGSQKVSDIMAEIATASTQQATGIEQVNITIAQMDDMTQQNAALVEQAAAASESLDAQGKSLHKLVDYFDTGAESYPVESTSSKKTDETTQNQVKRTVIRPLAEHEDDEWDEF